MNVRSPVPQARSRRVDSDVVAILAQATFSADELRLVGQLDPALYKRVDAVLKLIGGKWDRQRGAHVFADKPAGAAIEPILVAGTLTLPPDLGWFPTPAPLAADLVGLAHLRPGARVLEPSAGEGAIVAPLLAIGAQVHAVEIDPKRHAVLRDLMGDPVPVRCQRDDFLARAAEPVFDAVVMNPPFAPPTTDVAHVRHAFNFLARGGRLVAVMSAGTSYREDGRTADLRDLVHGFGGAITPLPDDSFKGSGTGVSTVVVTVTKPKGKAHG